ncbi:hypothetical protein C475_06945 [Halosimplex carlsbadense 2-9-1]|uniref:Lipoprotein n=1 Tax=Halosimplex carlsbadense 2-9-1 TaxID=797114 RepID=M0CYY6_9EURY|nr:hypothetical protein [Halosimplex carlsbadense]ELZ27637.1 hypothetical protein C475_06945 [Halosimplex carlsbadense 2-9-1]
MRASPLPAIVVALLLVAGCAGLPGAGGTEPAPDVSPDEFPNASAIDQSVFERHAAAMGNTSFTLSTDRTQKDRVLRPSERNYTYENSTFSYFVDPNDSQYLARGNGYFLGGNVTYYSNGNTTYEMWREDGETTVRPAFGFAVFNESNEEYLWRGFFNNATGNQHDFAAIDATFEREGVETFRGRPVMRYEAAGLDALADSWASGENVSSWFEEFSATILIDEDGVIRHYEYDFVWTEYATRRVTKSYTLSDVGSTDVERPGWAANVTAGS